MASDLPESTAAARQRRVAGLVLLALAFVLLVPGVTLPVLHLDGEIERSELARVGKQMLDESPDVNPLIAGLGGRLIDSLDTDGSIPAYAQTRSVLGTVQELWRHGNVVVGFLVLLFSVIVPVVKGALIGVATAGPRLWRDRSLAIAGAISKWSMADVFVIAVIVAFMAANANAGGDQLVRFDAHFGSGFFYFLGYCILSIASASLLPAASHVATPGK